MSQGDVDRAKVQLKGKVLNELSTPKGRFNDIVANALSGQIHGKDELINAIDGVSIAEVNAVSVCVKLLIHLTENLILNHFFCLYVHLLGGEKGCIRQMVDWRCR